MTVDSESDDRGLLAMDDEVPAGPFSVRVHVRAVADVDEERLRELVDWAERHAPVGDATRRAVPTTVDVHVEPAT